MTEAKPGPLVLVVDDEEPLREFLSDALEDNGYRVRTAGTGEEGLRMALAENPDVILLDVALPDTDGYALCRALRQKNTLRTKPILMLTVLNDSRHELLGLKAGADDYLTKPIDVPRLLARVGTAIRRNTRELDANPLTRLPGNTSIVQEIDRLLESHTPFHVIYGDLNQFKSYNDRYGFVRGDEVIRLTADCFMWSVESLSPGSVSFVGHVGGDDFVALVNPAASEKVCRELLTRFDERLPALYDEEDRRRGFLEGRTRQGQPAIYPLVGLGLVVVPVETGWFAHPAEISARASELKPQAKALGHSAYVLDRRRGAEGPRP